MSSRRRVLTALQASSQHRKLSTHPPCQNEVQIPVKKPPQIPIRLRKVLQLRDKRDRFAHLKSFFEGLGSTQTRENTWQPHHALNLPQHPGTLTLSSLVAAGAHLGHTPSLMNPNFAPYVYGTRAGVTIIDLDMTLPLLRRAAALVRGVALEDGAILFVGTRPDLKKVTIKSAQRLGPNGFHIAERWLPGMLTNRRTVFKLDSEDTGTTSQVRVMPDLVIFLNPLQNLTALRECAHANLPTIGIVDSNVDPRIVMYPIPANDASPRTAEIIAGVLSISGQEGLANRQMQIEALAISVMQAEDTEKAVREAVAIKRLPDIIYTELQERGFNLRTLKLVLDKYGFDIDRDLPSLSLSQYTVHLEEQQRQAWERMMQEAQGSVQEDQQGVVDGGNQSDEPADEQTDQYDEVQFNEKEYMNGEPELGDDGDEPTGFIEQEENHREH